MFTIVGVNATGKEFPLTRLAVVNGRIVKDGPQKFASLKAASDYLKQNPPAGAITLGIVDWQFVFEPE